MTGRRRRPRSVSSRTSIATICVADEVRVVIDLLEIEVGHVRPEVGEAPCDPGVVADDDAGYAGERGTCRPRTGTRSHGAAVQAHLVPDRRHRGAEVRVVGQHWGAGDRPRTADHPGVRADPLAARRAARDGTRPRRTRGASGRLRSSGSAVPPAPRRAAASRDRVPSRDVARRRRSAGSVVRVGGVQLLDPLRRQLAAISARSISACMLPRRSQAIALSHATESDRCPRFWRCRHRPVMPEQRRTRGPARRRSRASS